MSAAPREELLETVDRLRRRLWLERLAFGMLFACLAGMYAQPYVAPRRPRRPDAAQAEPARTTVSGNLARLEPNSDEAAEVRVRSPRAVIYVDGKAVAALPDRAAAERVLARLKRAVAPGLETFDAGPAFREKVEIREELAERSLCMGAGDALQLLQGGAGQTHTVAEGETAWTLAGKDPARLRELEGWNAGVDLKHLHLGQVIRTGPPSHPRVTVVAEGRLTELVPVAGSGTKNRPAWERITYRVRSENGQLVRREPVLREALNVQR